MVREWYCMQKQMQAVIIRLEVEERKDESEEDLNRRAMKKLTYYTADRHKTWFQTCEVQDVRCQKKREKIFFAVLHPLLLLAS